VALQIQVPMEKIEGILSQDEASFVADAEKHWAVVAQLLIIGEAVTRLSNEFRSSHPEIGWAKIAGMCNCLIHGYDKIRWEPVGRTATEAMPQLLEQIEPLLPMEEP